MKVFLLGKGYFSTPDEYRLNAAKNLIGFCMEGQEKKAVSQLFEVQGRPGMVIAFLLPAGIQFLIANYFLESYDTAVLAWVIYVFNFVIFLLILRSLFSLCRKMGMQDHASYAVIILYSVSVNGYLNLRHVTPLDISLLLSLMAYNSLLSAKGGSTRALVMQGLLNAASLLVYPGYYCLFFSFVLIGCWQNKGLCLQPKGWNKGVVFASAFIAPFFLLELLARMFQTSYLGELNQLGQTITQGSFDEGFTFVFSYLWHVESWVGVVYLAGLFFFFLFIKRSISNSNGNMIIYVVLISVFISFLGYCLMVYFAHKMLFTGRVLHQFMPFFSMATIVGFWLLFENTNQSHKFLAVLSVFLLLVSLPVYLRYYRVEYPKDFYRKVSGQHNLRPGQIDYHSQWTQCLWRKETLPDIHNKDGRRLVLVNWCHPSDGPPTDGFGWNRFIPQSHHSLLAKAPHYMSFSGYQFEGAKSEQRKALAEYPPELKVYQVKP